MQFFMYACKTRGLPQNEVSEWILKENSNLLFSWYWEHSNIANATQKAKKKRSFWTLIRITPKHLLKALKWREAFLVYLFVDAKKKLLYTDQFLQKTHASLSCFLNSLGKELNFSFIAIIIPRQKSVCMSSGVVQILYFIKNLNRVIWMLSVLKTECARQIQLFLLDKTLF